MRVMGVDHSTKNTGWGLIEISGTKDDIQYKYITHGFISQPEGSKYPETMFYMGSKLRDVLAKYKPDYVALEAPKDNRGFKATQVLTELVGVFKYILMKSKYGFTEIPPSSMKKIVSGYGWSTKEEVAIAVSKQLGLSFEDIVPVVYYKSGKKQGQVKEYILDGSDALGLAIAFIPYVRSQNGRLDYKCKEEHYVGEGRP